MHYFSVNYFVSQLSTTCVDTHSLPSPIVPPLQWKGLLLSLHIARLLFKEREVIWGLGAGGLEQLIELTVKTQPDSQPKTYLKPQSLFLQTPLMEAAPHKLRLALLSSHTSLYNLRHKLSCPVQGRKELCRSHSIFFPSPGMLVPLETRADLFLQMHFWYYLDKTCRNWWWGKTLGFFKFSGSAEFHPSAVLQFRYQLRGIFKIYPFCFPFNQALNLNK